MQASVMTAPSDQSMGNLIDILKANHEEADTRLVVHTAEAISQKKIAIICKDTDVILLLLHYF